MPLRDLLIPLFCIFVVGGAAVLAGVSLGLSPTANQVFGGTVIVAAYLYLDRRWKRAPVARTARPRAPYVSPFEVRFDDTHVVVVRDGKEFERVAWNDLHTVGVHIDDSFLPEPWFMLFTGQSTGAHYPGSARGAGEMLAELQRRLPAFDNEELIRSMGMMEGGAVLWQRPGARAEPTS